MAKRHGSGPFATARAPQHSAAPAGSQPVIDQQKRCLEKGANIAGSFRNAICAVSTTPVKS
jgi:hypothetical protein